MATYSGMSLLLAALGLICGGGCYYGHLAGGQAQLLLARQPIGEVLEDPSTPDELRDQLELVGEVRRFASDLGLAVEEKYTSYAPWPGDRIVTNLVATRPGEVEAVPNCFPIVGCVPYRGYFDEAAARERADELRAEGLDVCLLAVSAYSTLGWLDDPVTDPMLRRGQVELVETLLHELVHATVFLKDEPDFNEGVASFVGQEATLRFFDQRAPGAIDEAMPSATVSDRLFDNRELAAALVASRREVEALYAQPLSEDERTRGRQELEVEARARLAALALRTRTPEETRALAERIRLNDACLALRKTYAGDLERFAGVLRALDGNLRQFVERLIRAAQEEDPQLSFFSLAATPD